MVGSRLHQLLQTPSDTIGSIGNNKPPPSLSFFLHSQLLRFILSLKGLACKSGPLSSDGNAGVQYRGVSALSSTKDLDILHLKHETKTGMAVVD